MILNIDLGQVLLIYTLCDLLNKKVYSRLQMSLDINLTKLQNIRAESASSMFLDGIIIISGRTWWQKKPSTVANVDSGRVAGSFD